MLFLIFVSGPDKSRVVADDGKSGVVKRILYKLSRKPLCETLCLRKTICLGSVFLARTSVPLERIP